jgi:hypothetical protein
MAIPNTGNSRAFRTYVLTLCKPDFFGHRDGWLFLQGTLFVMVLAAFLPAAEITAEAMGGGPLSAEWLLGSESRVGKVTVWRR